MMASHHKKTSPLMIASSNQPEPDGMTDAVRSVSVDRSSAESEMRRVGVLSTHDSKETKAILNAAPALGHDPIWLRDETVTPWIVDGELQLSSRVDVDICLNGCWRTVTASITDRSEMTYPVLLGRDVLEACTVDISRTVEE